MYIVIFTVCSIATGLSLMNMGILINSIAYISHKKSVQSVHNCICWIIKYILDGRISILNMHWWKSVPSLTVLHIWDWKTFPQPRFWLPTFQTLFLFHQSCTFRPSTVYYFCLCFILLGLLIPFSWSSSIYYVLLR